jgi:CBS-domain-containing membrane protein
MDYVNQMQKSGAFSTNPTPNNPRPFTPNPSQMQSPLGKTGQDSSDTQDKLAQLQEAFTIQKQRFERTLGLLQNRIDALEKEVSDMKSGNTKIAQPHTKETEKQSVEKARDALFNHKEKEVSTKPIDRNRVAPSEVQIANIFNMSGKKF